MRKRNFDPLSITKNYFPKYIKQPAVINNGRCWIWAYLTFKSFKNVELWDTCGHAFIKHEDKFYDAERVNGELDWTNLPAANAGFVDPCDVCGPIGRTEALSLTEEAFQYHWASQTSRFATSWHKLEALIK